MDVEDLEVYKKLCQLHIEVCDLTHTWPKEEKYELGSQVRRSSNSSPAQLAEKKDDRHIRNKIEETGAGVKQPKQFITCIWLNLKDT
jgi:four helix bundle protein